MAHQGGIRQVQRLDHGREVIGIAVHAFAFQAFGTFEAAFFCLRRILARKCIGKYHRNYPIGRLPEYLHHDLSAHGEPGDVKPVDF